MTMEWIYFPTILALLYLGCVFAQVNDVTSEVINSQNYETTAINNEMITTSAANVVTNIHEIHTGPIDATMPNRDMVNTTHPDQTIPTSGNIPPKVTDITTPMGPSKVTQLPEGAEDDVNNTQTESTEESTLSETTSINNIDYEDMVNPISKLPVTIDEQEWMHKFLSTHHFEGQYSYNDIQYLFSFVARHKHQLDYKTLVATLYDQDGAVLEFNGTSADGHIIVFSLARMYTPGTRFPLTSPLQMTGSFRGQGGTYFTGNFTQPNNTSFSWFRMNKGLGTVETGETVGTRTAIIIIIPTSIAFLGICGTVAIICWASKKGFLRGRHKSYRLFTDAQVSYESEAETIHI